MGFEKIDDMCRSDRECGEFSAQRREAMEARGCLMEGLSPEERDAIDCYMNASENYWLRKNQIAYEFGKYVGHTMEQVIK